MKKAIHVTLDIEKLPEGYYVATSRDVQGLVAEAKTIEKVVEIATDIAHTLLKERKYTVSDRSYITYPLVITA